MHTYIHTYIQKNKQTDTWGETLTDTKEKKEGRRIKRERVIDKGAVRIK